MTRTKALAIAHRLSNPTKMPGWAYNLPAKYCKTGSKIRKVEGTSCSGCYAFEGWYPARTKELEKRYRAIKHPMWVEAMVYLVGHQRKEHFRWHDSGDIQSLDHLHKIVQICLRTPHVKHWLPTLEWGMIRKYWELHGKIPMKQLVPNLKITLSSIFVNGRAPKDLAKRLGVGCSYVSKGYKNCPALEQDHKCGDCRRCWDNSKFLTIFGYKGTKKERFHNHKYSKKGYIRTSYNGMPKGTRLRKDMTTTEIMTLN